MTPHGNYTKLTTESPSDQTSLSHFHEYWLHANVLKKRDSNRGNRCSRFSRKSIEFEDPSFVATLSPWISAAALQPLQQSWHQSKPHMYANHNDGNEGECETHTTTNDALGLTAPSFMRHGRCNYQTSAHGVDANFHLALPSQRKHRYPLHEKNRQHGHP